MIEPMNVQQSIPRSLAGRTPIIEQIHHAYAPPVIPVIVEAVGAGALLGCLVIAGVTVALARLGARVLDRNADRRSTP